MTIAPPPHVRATEHETFAAMTEWHVVRRKHLGRWLSAFLVIVVVGFIVYSFAKGEIDWSIVAQYFTAETILKGLWATILITVCSMALGVTLGTVIAIMRMSGNIVAQVVASGWVWLFRGVPVLLQLLIWFNLALVFPTFGIPGLWEVPMIEVMTPFMAALLGLGLHQSAYTAEIVRGGILSVDRGQVEAGQSLTLSNATILRRIVLPQAMRVIIPPLGNDFISTLKTSSLAGIVTFGELVLSAQIIYYRNNRVIELLMVVAIWYLIVVSVLSVGQHFLERRFGRGFGQRLSHGTTGRREPGATVARPDRNPDGTEPPPPAPAHEETRR
ncbi:MAG: amino acid ABC transporter permease [Microbacterium sp.]